ncbi:MAG: GatB/YqeY domain-containing protein [Candidatus Marinimicrobia bacterium]|nr:GatB/YqeY domain-containing protein [Candidatus Neomarinimicrobiota bacterium]
MDIQTQLKNDMMTAMKAKDTEKLNAIRMIRAAIQSKKLELNQELTEEDVMGVLIKAAKQRRDSITSYREGGREDLVAEEEKELSIIESYLPRQMDESEVTKIVEEVIASTGAVSLRDMGKVMAAIMPKIKGKADGNLVNTIVKSKLG